MQRLIIPFLVVACLLGDSQALTAANETYYWAGVVEFERISTTPIADRINTTLPLYLNIINSVDARQVDILVFPEATLNTIYDAVLVNFPHNDTVPLCDVPDAENLMKQLSCISRQVQKYIVINLYERANCTQEAIELNDDRPCSFNESDTNIYNTNVVFDHRGIVISKYRKVNLFNEYPVKASLSNELATFTTEFGVTFGHFICFDILFHHPAVRMVESGITDIIFPTMWFSELPFLTAVQTQQGFAHSLDVNFLGAGANGPSTGTSGSGIYNGRNGPRASFMGGTTTTRLLTGLVTKKGGVQSTKSVDTIPFVPEVDAIESRATTRNTAQDMLQFQTLFDDLTDYNSELLSYGYDSGTTINVTYTRRLCHDRICCDFDVQAAITAIPMGWTSYIYRAMVFRGERSFGGAANATVFSCGIVACTDNVTVTSCGKRMSSLSTFVENTNFERLIVQGDVSEASHSFIFPSNVDSGLLPYNPASEYSYTATGSSDRKTIEVSLLRAQRNLLTFGFFGRDFLSSSGSTFWISSWLAILVAARIILSN